LREDLGRVLCHAECIVHHALHRPMLSHSLHTPAPTPSVSWHEMSGHRAYLVRFARRKLLDPSAAEDLVHDVFEAVATGRARFDARSSLRTWLTGILKHKIVNQVRKRSRQISLDASTRHDDDAPAPMWAASDQPGPHEQAEQRQRLAQTMRRIEALPASLRRVVELYVLFDQTSAEVCHSLAITEQNLWVRLHRARRQLAA
jgi:RNA polymerase sigma-70 factor, ECF subfamily